LQVNPAARGPPEFGNWGTVYRRFLDWAKSGVVERMFNALSDALDLEVAMVPSRQIWLHQIVCRAADEMNARNATICISQRPQRKAPLEIDREMYKWRHLVDNFFCDLKDFERIATRSDKTDTVFSAMIYAASALINGR